MVTKANAKPTLVHSNQANAATGDDADVAAPVAKAVDDADVKPAALKPNLLGGKKNIFAQAAIEMTQQVSDKLTVMGSVRQQLAEASDLYNAGDDKAKEATEIADKAAVSLYQARTANTVSAEEVSAILGDIFGYKPKSDGSPGKTPAGQGEAIRKRVVRAVSADEFCQTGDGGRFFEGLPDDEIKSVLEAVSQGSMSIWTAYERFAEIKRDHATKTVFAFDPKRIAGLVESLSEDGAADILRASPSLVAAYGALIDILNIVGEQAAEETE